MMKFHKTVPQEIIDCIGEKDWVYILALDSSNWRNACLGFPPVPPIPTRRLSSYFHCGNIENIVEELQKITGREDYVKGSGVFCVDDENEICVDFDVVRIPTQAENKHYEKAMKVYQENVEKFNELKVILDAYKQISEQEKLTKEIANMQKKLDKLKKTHKISNSR